MKKRIIRQLVIGIFVCLPVVFLIIFYQLEQYKFYSQLIIGMGIFSSIATLRHVKELNDLFKNR